MKVYNKLVRNLIPQVIEGNGRSCQTRILSQEEHLNYLNVKLGEELQEYLESGDITELADLVEVVYGILSAKGVSIEEFETIRQAKRDERGGFEKGVFLVSTD